MSLSQSNRKDPDAVRRSLHPHALGLSPLEPLNGLGRALGLDPDRLLVLREDLLGTAGGGNKARKAYAALAEAAAAGVRAVVTTGAAQSNHARAVAMVGTRVGIDVTLVLEGEEPDLPRGNVLLEQLAGARLVWAAAEATDEVARRILAEMGERARLIPFGGSDANAVSVYETVGHSLRERVRDLAQVVVAVGSGATFAGLVSALGPDTVLGVDTGAVPNARETVSSLLASARPQRSWNSASLRLDRARVGTGYEHVQPEVLQAVRLALRHEGILFDVTYAGRALASLVDAAQRKQLSTVGTIVLVHTGGVPGLFGHPELQFLARSTPTTP